MKDSTENTNSTMPIPNTSGYGDPNAKPIEEPKVEPVVEEPKEITPAEMYGDEKTPEEQKVIDDKAAADKKIEEDKAAEEAKIDDPSTGYGKDKHIKKELTPEEQKVIDDAKSEDEKAAEANKVEVLEVLKDMPNKESIAEFAIANGFNKEQVTAYADMLKGQNAKSIENRDEMRSNWNQELMDDSTFGGENFDANVDKVEKVLQNYLPNMKKALTDKGGMMPPYLMRDLLSLSKTLNPTTELVDGEPSKLNNDKKEFTVQDMYE